MVAGSTYACAAVGDAGRFRQDGHEATLHSAAHAAWRSHCTFTSSQFVGGILPKLSASL
jgi:hypothetical protein